ncbi:MAG: hemolysin family protein [Phycisphaerales bacterium]|nr:hemolysin family protein [Phycisphaerales bacterium]
MLLVLLAPLLAISALFSGSETALFGLNSRHRMALKDRDRRSDRAVGSMLRAPRQLLITIMVGNMAANISWFTIIAVLATQQPWGAPGAALVQLGGVLGLVMAGEVIPKVIASADPLRAARFVGRPLNGVHLALLPLRRVVEAGAIGPLSRLAGVRRPEDDVTSADLDGLLKHSAQAGLVDDHEQRFLTGILELGRRPAKQVMTPRTRMVSIAPDDDEETIARAFTSSGLTRLPVRGDDMDDIRGMLFARQWLAAGRPTKIDDLLHEPAFTPAVAPIERVLQTLQREGRKTAIVVDEYGGTAGIISIRDLVEPLTGEFDDPDAAAPSARPIGPGRWIVDGGYAAAGLLALIGRSSTGALTVAELIRSEVDNVSEGAIVRLGRLLLEVHHIDESGVIETVLLTMQDRGGKA